MEVGLGAGLGALGFWLFIAAIVVAGIWSVERQRTTKHETLRRLVESGQTIDDRIIDKVLSKDHDRMDQDLKIASLIMLFIAPGLALFGWIMRSLDPDILQPLLGVSVLVAFIGIGLWVAGTYAKAQKEKERNGS